MKKSCVDRKFRDNLAAVMFLAVLLFTPSPGADASTFVVPELDDLVAMSSAVVDGIVVSRDSRVSDGRIVTDYTVLVSDVVAGCVDDGDLTDGCDAGAGSKVTFTFPGGTVGDTGELVTGVPVFAAGDEVVLFLKRPAPEIEAGRPGFHLVTGMAVGALKVRRYSDRTATVHGMAARAFNRAFTDIDGSCDSATAGTDMPPMTFPASPSSPDSAPLPEFLDAVRGVAPGNGGAK